MSEENNKGATALKYTIAKRVATVAAIFAVILSVLMIVNYLQTKSIDPLNSKAITQLILQLQEKDFRFVSLSGLISKETGT